jgi:hypothetical protein
VELGAVRGGQPHILRGGGGGQVIGAGERASGWLQHTSQPTHMMHSP